MKMDFVGFLPLIGVFVIFYFLVFRPQATKQKEHLAMIQALKIGNQVLLDNGIYGKITKVEDNNLMVEIAPDVKIKVVKVAVAKII